MSADIRENVRDLQLAGRGPADEPFAVDQVLAIECGGAPDRIWAPLACGAREIIRARRASENP